MKNKKPTSKSVLHYFKQFLSMPGWAFGIISQNLEQYILDLDIDAAKEALAMILALAED